MNRPRYDVPGKKSQMPAIRSLGGEALGLRPIWDAVSGTPHLGRSIWDALGRGYEQTRPTLTSTLATLSLRWVNTARVRRVQTSHWACSRVHEKCDSVPRTPP